MMSEDVVFSKYFEKQIKILRFCGTSLFNNEGLGYRVYSMIYLSLVLLYPVVSFGDLFKHDFDVVSDLLIYEIASSMANAEVIVVLFKRKKLRKILEKLEEKPYIPDKERGGDVEEKLINRCVRITSVLTMVCWSSVLLTVGMVTVTTLIKRIESSDYHDWEFTYGPLTVLNVTYSPNYEITWLYQVICTASLGFNHSTINLIMAGILAHVTAQFQILQNNLRRMVPNAYRLMLKDKVHTHNLENTRKIDGSKIPWKYLKKSLDKAVMYHLKILEIFTEMEDIFSTQLLTVFMFSLGVMCFIVFHGSLLSINDIRLAKAFTDATTALFPILLLCYWSQEMTYESQRVNKAVIEAKFEGADLRFQKSLNLIMIRSQRGAQLKAGKFIEISLPTFVWILRTSYSAFMMLRKINMEKYP